MPKPKKVEIYEEAIQEVQRREEEVVSEKAHLLALYQELLDRNIRSISDLENLIARS